MRDFYHISHKPKEKAEAINPETFGTLNSKAFENMERTDSKDISDADLLELVNEAIKLNDEILKILREK